MRTPRLLALARETGNPVIEKGVATFIWQGSSSPLLITDYYDWEDDPQKLSRAGTNLWSYSIPLPEDAYLEYAFLDGNTGERLPDPLNPNRVDNGVDGNFNQFFYMPKGKPSPLVNMKKGIPHGTIARSEVPTHEYALGTKRAIYLYQPPVDEPVPLVVVYDGYDYLHRGKLNLVVDNLIAQKQIRPIAMALIQNGGQARTLEYSCSEATLAFIIESVIPAAKENLSLISPDEERYGVIGASLGGLMALYTGLRLPKLFTKVLSQSGAFGTPEYRYGIVDLVRYAPRSDIQVWMDAGCFEWLLEGNRKMYALLKKKEYWVKFREFPGGHNYTSWRNDIAHGLKKLFGS